MTPLDVVVYGCTVLDGYTVVLGLIGADPGAERLVTPHPNMGKSGSASVMPLTPPTRGKIDRLGTRNHGVIPSLIMEKRLR